MTLASSLVSPSCGCATGSSGSTIASAFAPQFPPQLADQSYGLSLNRDTVRLVDVGGEATAHVPSDDALGNAWTQVGFDDSGFGSHAQYKTISEDKGLTIIPETITYEQAAASTEGAHYAYSFINKVALKRGQNVLVNGATGAIGSAAVQLLKYFGANITATCNTGAFG